MTGWRGLIVLVTLTLALTLWLRHARAEVGLASYYWQGRATASGERFNPDALTAAHKTLPFGQIIRVTNLRNGRGVTVRINDRGPWIRGRILDLSRAAAREIRMTAHGVAKVKLTLIKR